MSLNGYVEKFAALIETKNADSSAPQLELLHEICQLLKTTPPDEIKACQPALEKGLTGAIVLARRASHPSPPPCLPLSSAATSDRLAPPLIRRARPRPFAG